MAPTKRKRRNKHRGNAVGIVEARGRTSKPREGEGKGGKGASGRGGSGGRGATARGTALKPPTLQSAAIKAAVGAVILFVFFAVLSKGTTTGSAAFMSLVAVLLYTPIMYMTDKWIYSRKLKQQGGGTAKARR